MTTASIYILTSKNNDSIYVGKTIKSVNTRLSKHIYESKYGCDSMKCRWIKDNNYSINIEVVDIVNVDDWVFWECYWISYFTNYGFNLVNSNSGGGGVNKHSKEFSDWLSNRNIGNTYMLGKKHSEKTKEILREVNLGKVGPNKGKNFSQEWRDNLSKAKKGKTSNRKGTKWSKSTRDKKQKSILQLDKNSKIINVWDSIRSASNSLGISEGNIVTVCKGNRKTAGGFNWEYK